MSSQIAFMMRIVTAIVSCLSLAAVSLAAQATVNQKPNFIVILTDDQDLRMDSMEYMPQVKKHLTDNGMYFNHHYATVALCCPSRASMWTGKAAHNTNITDLAPPYGELKHSVQVYTDVIYTDS